MILKAEVVRAYGFAEQAHKGQVRKFSGLPYFSHPKGVSRLIVERCVDDYMVSASLLHDVLEDTKVTEEELREQFSTEVCSLVVELTSDSDLQRRQGKQNYLAIKMLSMSNKALTIKLADRLHNVLYLQGDEVSVDFIKKYYHETVFIIMAIKDKRRDLTSVQEGLLDDIECVLRFLKLRHRL